METDEPTMEEKCEQLMNVVVESRKRFGKRCVDYEKKTSVMENQLLHLQISTISNCKLKSPPPRVDHAEMCKDIDGFTTEILEKMQRIEQLRKKVKDTQEIVVQLKQDGVSQIMHQPLTAEAMLANAKQKQLDR